LPEHVDLSCFDLAPVWQQLLSPQAGVDETAIKNAAPRSAITVSADKRQQSRQMRGFLSMISSSRDLFPRFSWIQDGTSFALGWR
jgi:hypothetical protein